MPGLATAEAPGVLSWEGLETGPTVNDSDTPPPPPPPPPPTPPGPPPGAPPPPGQEGSVGKVLAVEHQDLSLIPRICIKSVYNGILGM